MSGTYEAARLAASRTDAPGTIHVINSLSGSLGQGQLAVLAAECAELGLDASTTLAAIHEQIPHVSGYGMVNDMQYAVRGGRMPGWVKSIAEALRLSPIISITPAGRLTLTGALFGRRNRIERFARYVLKRIPSGPVEIGIGHAICEEDARQLEKYLRDMVPDIRKLVVTGLGPGIGAHAGPGTIIAFSRPWVSAQDIANRSN